MASEQSGWSTTQVLLAFVAGAAAGAAAAWVLGSTPSGRAARGRVKDAAGAAAEKVRIAAGDMRGALRRATAAARDAYDEAIDPHRG